MSVLFLLPVSVTLSQTTVIDSLERAYSLDLPDSLRIRILKDISWEYLNNRYNADLAAKYIDSINALSIQSRLPWGQALAQYQYAVLERQKGNYSKALEHIDSYLEAPTTQKDEMARANGLYQKAVILDDLGSFDASLDMYYDILRFYEKEKDSFSIATTMNALGEILKKTDKPEQAMTNYSEALRIFQSLGDSVEMANCYFNIGDTFLQEANYEKALGNFSQALAIDRALESDWGMAYDLESLGKVYSLQGDYTRALEFHGKALELRRELHQQRELAMSFHEIGRNQMHMGSYEAAEANLLRAIEIFESIKARSELQEAFGTISVLYAQKGELRKALAYKDRFILIKDSLYNETRSRQVEELQVRFDTEKKQAAIAALEKDAMIADLRLRRQTTLRNIIIGVAVAGILFFIGIFNRYKYRQKSKQQAEERERQLLEEQRKTEMEKKRVAELQKIDSLKDEFLANTSHELRTPLNGIIGLSESLQDGIAGKLPAGALEHLEMISNSGRRLSHLVNDILDFSKLKNKDLQLSIQPVDMNALVSVVLKLSQPLAREKGLQLIQAVPADIPMVDADENRVQQILHNLVGNAIKFTESGSVQIGAMVEDDMVVVSVEDTGIGIAEENLGLIFESFEQADSSSRRQFGGTGLGLAITRKLVELHGGSIQVSSSPGKGSIFRFSLPISTEQDKDRGAFHWESEPVQRLSQEEEGVTAADAPGPDPEGGALGRILVVDDEPVNRRVLQNHLTLAGYSVTEAVSGTEALEKIASGQVYDLVLLDIMMPGMSGFEVCEILRKRYLSSELPIVLLTAKNRVSDLVNGFNLGANDYLTKPFSKNELLSRIKTHLHLHGIHKATNRFVPTEFIRSVGRDAITEVRLGDHVEKEVTVLFSDIRDYTSLAEEMSPKQNFKFVNAYVGKMGPIIQENNGFVNQYLGDGIMALFPQSARDALSAAVGMQQALQAYNKRRVAEGFRPLKTGIGLHTGPLVMGIIGDAIRNDTAIIADTVNTASRMEGVTKFYGARIILSESSLKRIPDPDKFSFRYLGMVRVKGKDKPLAIYECFDGDPPEMIALKKKSLKDFDKGMSFFFGNQFPRASACFDKVLAANPDDLVAQYFIARAAQFTLANITKDEDVVNIMEEK